MSKEYRCSVCGRLFYNPTSMKNHRRWHDSSFRKRVTEKIQAIWKDPNYKISTGKRISKAKTGKPHKPHSEETKLKMSLNNSRYWKGKHRSKEWKEKVSDKLILHRQRPEVKQKTSEVSKKLWQNTVYREIVIKNALKGLMKRPTSFEQKLIDLINENNLPFKYIGNGEIIIGYRNPDFIEINGKKLLIETYAKFWHPKNYEEQRFKLFQKYGYRTLFLSEDHLQPRNWKEICLNKIQLFVNAN